MKLKPEKCCPFCWSTEIDYGSLELQGTQVYYPCTCKKCKNRFKLWYKLEYEDTTLG